MSETDRLIDALVADARPVRRLGPPSLRWCLWAAIALLVATAILLTHGVRGDLEECITEAAFLTGTAAPLATGLLAAAGVLFACMPDRSSRWLLLPLPAALVWFGGITGGCLLDWSETDFSMIALAGVLECLGILVLVCLPLSLAQFLMLRPFARIAPRGALAVASLATAGIAAAVLNLVHAFETSAMLLIWSMGAGAFIFLLDTLAARGMLRWLRPAAPVYAAR